MKKIPKFYGDRMFINVFKDPARVVIIGNTGERKRPQLEATTKQQIVGNEILCVL
jgi:hypothetical protein